MTWGILLGIVIVVGLWFVCALMAYVLAKKVVYMYSISFGVCVIIRPLVLGLTIAAIVTDWREK